jgi:YVTN family beta-propeller protein
VLLGVLAAGCSAPQESRVLSPPSTIGPSAPSAEASATVAPTATAPVTASPSVANVYESTLSGQLDPRVAGVPQRVYVPNEESDSVTVIDAESLEVIDEFAVGDAPEHVSPDWGMEHLWVANMNGGFLTKVDPRTSRPIDEVDLPIFPYALYYTVDGSKVMVVTDYISEQDLPDNGVTFYDPETWEQLAFVNVPWPGADDADLTADARYLAISAEYSGYVAFIDTEEMTLAGSVEVGSLPRDVRLSPDGATFYVTNEGLGGVQTIDADTWELTGFIATGDGAHGIDFSRDTTRMYVANRAAGTISVVDLATNTVEETWPVGGSPDEMVLNPDGSHLWTSNRYHASVSVIDTSDGSVIATIGVGANPHGLTYWPQPGTMAIGQNGNMR